MKLAIIYSGEPRSYAKVKQQHFEFFEGFDYDSYHSTWSKTSEEDQKLIISAPNIKGAAMVDYNIPNQPDILRFEKTLLHMKKDHPIFMLNRIQYMTSQAVKLPSQLYYSYDLIVRMRYDFEYEGKFSDLVPEHIAAHDIFITRKMGGKSHEHNVWDGFAFGSPIAMSLYFDFYKWIPFSIYHPAVRNWKFQPEFVYGTYLRMCELNVRDCGVQPVHVYPDGKDVNWHRTERTVQYYRDLAVFHPEYYTQSNGKLTIINDSPIVTDQYVIDTLEREGLQCTEVKREQH